jgi:hypothetical protein
MKKEILRITATFFLLFFFLVFFTFSQRKEKRLEYQLSIQDEQGNEIGLYSKSYALLIGVSEYSAGWPVLP